jgi:hypothetical protein
MTVPSDWDYALSGARDYSKPYADALVQVLDTAWSVEAYLKEKGMPHDGATIASLTAQVLAREGQLKEVQG